MSMVVYTLEQRLGKWACDSFWSYVWVYKPANCHIYCTENLQAYIKKRLHPKRVTIWCGFRSRGIIEFFFLRENEQGETVTVNGDRYRATLYEFLFTNIGEDDIGNIWFQHYGVTCHTVEVTLDDLRSVFEDNNAVELMSLGHLAAAICLRWIIICGVPSKISVTPISQT